MGRFTDVTKEVGIDHTGREEDVSFTDFDNDGFLDLYVMSEDGDILYRNSDQGKFENVTVCSVPMKRKSVWPKPRTTCW